MLILVIGYFMWRTLKLMPRTKPQEITPRSKSAVTWDDVAGVEETKDELREVVEFLSDPKRFKRLGAKVPKGILLHGPPGTGKTLLAKAVAHESGANFFSQSASSFIEMFAGLGAARIRRLFKEARENAPAIVFIDELDAVGAQRGSDISGERDQTLNQLLVEMDGFDARDNVVVMAASNLLEKLDKALLRPGRFDRQVFVPPPDMRGREQILAVHTRDKPLAQDVDLDRVARHAAGLTGADLANLANEAAILAGRRQRDFIAQADFEDAFERVVAGLQTRKVITDAGEARRRLARGRARARLRAAADRRQGAEGLDRPARQGARLHAQPAAGGPLPEVAPGADRLHEGAARGPGLRADHLRPGDHRRLRRPRPRDRHRALDGLRVRDGDHDPLPPGPRRRLHRLRVAAPDPRRGGRRRSPRRPTAAPTSCSPTTATCSTRSPSACSPTR